MWYLSPYNLRSLTLHYNNAFNQIVCNNWKYNVKNGRIKGEFILHSQGYSLELLVGLCGPGNLLFEDTSEVFIMDTMA